MSHSLDAYLILSSLLFAIGTFGFLARRNAIAMTRTEIVTIAPLVVLAVAFGLFPGLLLQLWQTPITDILSQIAPATLAALP